MKRTRHEMTERSARTGRSTRALDAPTGARVAARTKPGDRERGVQEAFLRGAADRVERLIWTRPDASDDADGGRLVPRVVPCGPQPAIDAA
jgi:hypothetical protein